MSEQEAGPAMDADVAELMGWKPNTPCKDEYGDTPTVDRDTHWACSKCVRAGQWGDNGFEEHDELPLKYSTDIATAFLVVERMRQNWTDFFLQFREYDQPGDGWYCSFRYAGPIILASTAPLAICRAALSAVSRPTQEGAP